MIPGLAQQRHAICPVNTIGTTYMAQLPPTSIFTLEFLLRFLLTLEQNHFKIKTYWIKFSCWMVQYTHE